MVKKFDKEGSFITENLSNIEDCATKSLNGKPKSFEVCLTQYEPMIKSLIKKIRVYKQYEEYYQIGQIALWQAYENFNEEKGSFTTFAYVTVRGKMLNQLSKERLYEERFVPVDVYDEQPYTQDQEAAFSFEQFVSLLEGISPLQQQILIDRFYFNMSFPEIAAKTGMAENSARSSYRYALKRLRK
jgi:DNA-directed RNA polymerase